VGGNGAGLAAVVVLFVAVMLMIPTVVQIAAPGSRGVVANPATPVAVARATGGAPEIVVTEAVAVEMTPTPTLVVTESVPTIVLETPTLEVSNFYTEEFNVEPVSWSQFMTSGDSRMVRRSFTPGILAVQLLKLDSKIARYYMIMMLSHTPTKVEAVVTNRGNNANGVSLICRYMILAGMSFGFELRVYEINVVDNGIVNRVTPNYSRLVQLPSKPVYRRTCTRSHAEAMS
jgi:hypothetical protein